MNTQSLTRTASWVIIDRTTGKAVLETFNSYIVDRINLQRYDVLPILAYLQGVAARVKYDQLIEGDRV